MANFLFKSRSRLDERPSDLQLLSIRNSTNYSGLLLVNMTCVPLCFFTMPRTVLAGAGSNIVARVWIINSSRSAPRGEVPNTSTIPLGWDGSVNYLVVAESSLWVKGETKRRVTKIAKFPLYQDGLLRQLYFCLLFKPLNNRPSFPSTMFLPIRNTPGEGGH